MKLFRSKKKSLLVVDGTCINGSKNRIRPGNKALVHIRSSSYLPENIGGIEFMVNALIKDDESSAQLMNKGCWVNANGKKRMVIKARANIERNRRGDRLLECIELLAVQEQEDESYLPTSGNDEFNEYGVDENETGDIISNPIDLKCERHRIFAHWLIDTYGKERLACGTGVLDVAGGNGMISHTLAEMGIPSTLLDPNPRHSTNKCEPNNGQDDGDNANQSSFGVIPYPLNGDGTDLTSRNDDISYTINNCSLICGLHPDQATEPIVTLALRLNVPFAIL